MKLSKLIFAAAVAAAFIGAGAEARAQVADGTYVFTATDGNTDLNGSSVTFKNDQLVSWDMMDAVAQTLYSPSANSWYTTTLPLTPANSITGLAFDTDYSTTAFQWDGVLGPNEWSFHIISDTWGVNYYDFFTAGNNVDTSGSSLGDLYDGFGDPHGNWCLSTNSVPDAASTLALFASALAGLGVWRKTHFQVRRLAFNRA